MAERLYPSAEYCRRYRLRRKGLLPAVTRYTERVTVSVSHHIVAAIDEEAERHGVSRGDVLRDILRTAVERLAQRP